MPPPLNEPDTLTYQPNRPMRQAPDPSLSPGEALIETLTRGPNQPLDHDPAQLPPYPGAVCLDRHAPPAGRQYADENATYEIKGPSVEQVLTHYRQAALAQQFVFLDERAIDSSPGGRRLAMRRGNDWLIFQFESIEPPSIPPPLVQDLPKVIVTIQFRYPIDSPRP